MTNSRILKELDSIIAFAALNVNSNLELKNKATRLRKSLESIHSPASLKRVKKNPLSDETIAKMLLNRKKTRERIK